MINITLLLYMLTSETYAYQTLLAYIVNTQISCFPFFNLDFYVQKM